VAVHLRIADRRPGKPGNLAVYGVHPGAVEFVANMLFLPSAAEEPQRSARLRSNVALR
jgi:hypothetical protein